MPEITPPTDGDKGNAGAGAPAAGAGAPPPEKTFTQAELDAILEARLKRAIPADYEELKTLAAKAKERDEADKTDLQKAQEAQALAEKKARDREQTANLRLKRAAIIEAATAANAADTDIVIALLMGDEAITVEEDGSVKGAAKAVKDLIAAKPFLAKSAAGTASGGQFGGQDHKTLDERIREAEGKGDLATARSLKLQKMTTAQ